MGQVSPDYDTPEEIALFESVKDRDVASTRKYIHEMVLSSSCNGCVKFGPLQNLINEESLKDLSVNELEDGDLQFFFEVMKNLGTWYDEMKIGIKERVSCLKMKEIMSLPDAIKLGEVLVVNPWITSLNVSVIYEVFRFRKRILSFATNLSFIKKLDFTLHAGSEHFLMGMKGLFYPLAESSNLELLKLNINHNEKMSFFVNEIGHIGKLIEKSSSIRYCDLRFQKISPEDIGRISRGLEVNSSLVVLNFRGAKLNFTREYLDQFSKALRRHKTLRSIDLCESHISDDGVIAISKALKENRSLYSLDLSYNMITTLCMREFAESLKNSKLGWLNLSSNPTIKNGMAHVFSSLKHNKNLVGLFVRDCGFGDKCMVELGEMLKVNKVLVELGLSENRVTDIGFEKLCGGLIHNRTLSKLNLLDNNLTSNSMKSMSEVFVQGNNSLCELNYMYKQDENIALALSDKQTEFAQWEISLAINCLRSIQDILENGFNYLYYVDIFDDLFEEVNEEAQILFVNTIDPEGLRLFKGRVREILCDEKHLVGEERILFEKKLARCEMVKRVFQYRKKLLGAIQSKNYVDLCVVIQI